MERISIFSHTKPSTRAALPKMNQLIYWPPSEALLSKPTILMLGKKKKKNVQDATSSSGKRGEESGGLIFTRECLGKLNKLDWLLVLIILLFYYYSELSVTSLRSFLRLFFFCLTLKKTCVWSHCGERFAVQRINRTLLPLWVVVFFFPLRQWRMDSNPMFLISHYDKSCRLLHINGDC